MMEFSTLVGLLDGVFLHTNYIKTVGIVYHPCQTAGTQSEAAYGRRMTVEGASYREGHKVRVQCSYCGEEMVAGSMSGKMTTQHGRAAEERWSCITSATG